MPYIIEPRVTGRVN